MNAAARLIFGTCPNEALGTNSAPDGDEAALRDKHRGRLS